MRIRLQQTPLLVALTVLLAPATVAAAHPGHSHALLRTSPSLFDAVNEDLHGLADVQLRATAPAAVRGRCVQTIDVPGQGDSCRLSGGLWGVKRADGTTESTHGPDFPAGLYHRTDMEPAELLELDAAKDLVTHPHDSDYVACVTNLNVPHYVAVYARPSNLSGDDPAQTVQDMRASLREASRFVQLEATADGSTTPVRLRLQCTADGTIDVQVKTVATSVVDTSIDFTSIEDAIRASGATGGHDATARIVAYYPVEPDSGASGQGSLYSDDRQGVANYNDLATQTAIHYAIGGDEQDWSTYLHEMLHNMGAVQSGGRFSTGHNGHCSSDIDIMCYDDDFNAATYPMVTRCASYVRLDCTGDTYFNAGIPAAGSWLGAHWNAGSVLNRYLDFGSRTVDVTPPSTPSGLSVTPTGIGSAVARWSPSADDFPQPLTYQLTMIDTSTHSPVTRDAGPGEQQLTGLSASQFVASVVAVDAAGNRSDPSLPVTVDMPDRSVLQPALTLHVTKVAGRTATFAWRDTNGSRPGHVYQPQLLGSTGTYANVGAAVQAPSASVTAPSGTRASVRVLSHLAGIIDTASEAITFGTPVAPSRCTWKANDRTPPGKLGAARTTTRRGTTVTVAWTKPTDANGVCAIRFVRKVGRSWVPFGPAVAATRTSAKLTGVTTKTTLAVEAFDAAGNLTKPVPVAPKR